MQEKSSQHKSCNLFALLVNKIKFHVNISISRNLNNYDEHQHNYDAC